MTIEIHEPELEALIESRMATGVFRDMEDVIVQTLRAGLVTGATQVTAAAASPRKNLSQFLLESPLAGSGLKLERIHDAPRSVEF